MSNPKQNNPLPGFPRVGKFKTKEEVDAYFATEKIQCLLCGKWFESIGSTHMTRKHGISGDDYREMYGLPWSRGLDGRRLFEKKIILGKKLWLEGNRPDIEKAHREARKAKQRPTQPYQKDYYSKSMLALHGLTRKYRLEDIEAVLDRMRIQQRSLEDVCDDPDMPSNRIVRNYAMKHPEFEDEIKRTYL
ncbi:MAG: MucR family transcriptional regulator [Proteobacteria bacterium]|nr:MucR family transcriptional regulator [Pseudomonadota bacterium]